ncbi:MAG: hypothetical protein K0R18_159 [Bacillales bacterium]|jgi:hypothetical protein|nr:hypothetical protein [Bacillales bacterium]
MATFKKKKITYEDSICGGDYYFNIKFWGDSISPYHKVKMYQKSKFWVFDYYEFLWEEIYEYDIPFQTICDRTFEKFAKAQRQYREFESK